MISKFIFWHLMIIVPTLCALLFRRSLALRVICIIMILTWTWSLLAGGLTCSMRNSINQLDRGRSQEYKDGWFDGARATQTMANNYRSPLFTAVLCVAVLALIPIRKKERPNKAIEAIGDPGSPQPHG